MRILLIEDDKALCQVLQPTLQAAGFASDCCHTGADGLHLLKTGYYDACILDRMLPELDGLTLLKSARADGVSIPVLMLTALGQIGDRVEGLDAGADDYLAKPFDNRELLARLRIWSRRTVSLEDPGELCFGDLSYRPSVRQLSGPAGKEVLPKRLAQLIELLLRNAEVPITRNVIFNRIWGPDAEVTDAVIDTYIHLTRQRLAHLQSAVKIQNSRGTGYQLSYEREL